LIPCLKHAKWRIFFTESTIIGPKWFKSKYSCIFKELMNRHTYACLVVLVKSPWGKGSCASSIRQGDVFFGHFSYRITVLVFLSTFQLTPLRLKGFHLRLHCNIIVVFNSLFTITAQNLMHRSDKFDNELIHWLTFGWPAVCLFAELYSDSKYARNE